MARRRYHGRPGSYSRRRSENDAGAFADRVPPADPVERLKRCVECLQRRSHRRGAGATASACVEVNDFDAAARDLDEAIALAPDWAAAHYERGKLWLRVDDMVKASESFQAPPACCRRFAPAWANLGGPWGIRSARRSAGGLRARARAGAGRPAGPEQCRRRPARTGPPERIRSRLPPGHPAHHRTWPLAITIWGIHCFYRAVSRRRCRRMRKARPGTRKRIPCRRRGWRCASWPRAMRRGRARDCSARSRVAARLSPAVAGRHERHLVGAGDAAPGIAAVAAACTNG